jgi:hypothetical protein
MNVNITLLTTTTCAARPADRLAGASCETTESMYSTWEMNPEKADWRLALWGRRREKIPGSLRGRDLLRR